MINAVGPINNVYSKPVQFRGTPQETVQDKKGMTTTQKTLVGLGALAALTVGGLLVKKHIDTKAIKSLIEKPQEFNNTYFEKFAQKWADELKLKAGAKGDITLMSKKRMAKFISDVEKEGDPVTQLQKVYDQMSDNGILAILNNQGEVYYKYLDPEKITAKVQTRQSGLKELKDIFAEDTVYVKNFKVDKPDDLTANICWN